MLFLAIGAQPAQLKLDRRREQLCDFAPLKEPQNTAILKFSNSLQNPIMFDVWWVAYRLHYRKALGSSSVLLQAHDVTLDPRGGTPCHGT